MKGELIILSRIMKEIIKIKKYFSNRFKISKNYMFRTEN